MPTKSAAACPLFFWQWIGLASGQSFVAASSRGSVASVLPSLTKIAS
jgi:hypothetical protein